MLKTLLTSKNLSPCTLLYICCKDMHLPTPVLAPMEKTQAQYTEVIARCRATFEQKMADYGSSWRILRTSSLTDQLFIKAQRIRSIEEKGVSLVNESIEGEYESIVNYCIIALIQCELGPAEEPHMDIAKAQTLYTHYSTEAYNLMLRKNHDYGEAWRSMRISSLTDLILSKLMRIKQIEDNEGKTLVSEGVESNYYDMLNYAVFALVKLGE